MNEPLIKNGTVGGTLTILFANIHASDLGKTIVLAAVGAIVSCGVSILLKKLLVKKSDPPKSS